MPCRAPRKPRNTNDAGPGILVPGPASLSGQHAGQPRGMITGTPPYPATYASVRVMLSHIAIQMIQGTETPLPNAAARQPLSMGPRRTGCSSSGG